MKISLAEVLDLTNPLPSAVGQPERFPQQATLILERCTCRRCNRSFDTPVGAQILWRFKDENGDWQSKTTTETKNMPVEARGEIKFVHRSVAVCQGCWVEG